MLFPWDQLNLIRTKIESVGIAYASGGVERRYLRPRDCEDFILEFLIDSYLMGLDSAREQLDPTGEKADKTKPSTDEMYKTIYRKIDGKNFVQRVSEYAKEGDVDSIMRVAETESHRVFNDSSLNTAKKLGASEKTWNCMFVNSRETHMYLHGTEVPIDAEFYTFMGNHAMYPGQFGVAEEDCNCHCWLTYK